MNIVRGFYWDRVARLIISPLVVITCIALFIHYIPPMVAEDIAKQQKYERIHAEAKKIRDTKIFSQKCAERNKQVEAWKEEQSKAREIKNVQESTLRYQTLCTLDKYPIGTYVMCKEFGSGKVKEVSGFEVKTKEGWVFYSDEEYNEERKISYCSYWEYLKNKR